MKKIISVLLVILTLSTVLVGCGNHKADSTVVRLGALKGATSMGLVKLLSDAEQTPNTYEFTMATTADELTPKLLKGELDILAVPANLGSVLYNNSNGAVQMLAINTLGVLYIVEKGGETVTDLASLQGKTVFATGKGSTPEFALTYLLSQAGLILGKDVNVEWKSEPTEVVTEMATMDSAVAMLPQPFVTVAKTQIDDLKIALDLTEEWNKLGTDGKFITGAMIVRKEFAQDHPDAVKKFLTDYSASVDYVNQNIEAAAALVEKYGIVKAPIAKQAIPYCNIVCIRGEEMKKMATGYLQVLFDQKSASVGGQLPGEDFYCIYE